MPFLVTTCDGDGVIRFWEWDVDPLTRRPNVPVDDVAEIAELIDAAELIYLHNAKFDARALRNIGIDLPWPKVRDTLIASHLLATNHRHDLTWCCIEYLGVDIEPFELSVKEATVACRARVKTTNPDWRIATEGLPDMPSTKGGSKRDEDRPWKADMWLPRAVARNHDDYDPQWLTACSRYANADSEHTIYLGLELERLIRSRGYWAIYEHRLNLPRVACEMECYGVTTIGKYTNTTIAEYEQYSAEAEAALCAIAAEYGHRLEVADGAALNDNMREFFYGAVIQTCPGCGYTKHVKHWTLECDIDWMPPATCPKCAKWNTRLRAVTRELVTTRRDNLKLPVVSKARGGGRKAVSASLDKDAMAEYLETLDGKPHDFIRILTEKRQHDTDLSYMHAYRRFWLPIAGSPGYSRIHPSLNPCGTDHLRWASNSPNLQNVGKQEDEWRVSVRNCFGPAPGREWWSMDFQNIELRIPAYESGEEAMVALFEQPDQPPYYGSYHCLNASIVYPDEFWPLADTEGDFKKKYKSTLYQWTKNGGFALQYGCGECKADATFRRRGAYRLLKEKLPRVAALAQTYLDLAMRTGYVETLPDRTVDAKRGYPILASRTEDGSVLSTTPFNYHVSGTACWAKNTALVRCSDQCAQWRAEGFDASVSLEIHDEIIFDFPRGATMEENLPRALILKGLMEQSGQNLVPYIPTPVSVEYHATTWAKGIAI